jgi:hypothetical protein
MSIVHMDEHVHSYSGTNERNYTVRNYYIMLTSVSSKISVEEFIYLKLTADY